MRLAALFGLAALLACTPETDAPADPSAAAAGDGLATRDLFAYGAEQDSAIEIAPGIFQSLGTGNAQMVVTSEGNVVFDTGLSNQPEVQERLRAADPGPVRHVILSHAHADHYSAVDAFAGEDTEIWAHAEFVHNQRYLKALAPLFMARNAIFFPDNVPAIPGVLSGLLKRLYPTVAPTRLVVAAEAFTLGGTRFEVLPLPGAEGSDGLALWLPKEEILFVGDFFGASFPMWPNLTTMRGERARFPKPYLDSLDRVLVLDPRILVPSHFEPITDREAIREGVQRTRDAVAYVEQAVIDGMNDGKDVYTLMREIILPPDLALPEVHGKVAWGVRSIWEAYSGWFHLRSTTELYAVPASAIYPEIAEAIGGPGSAIARAKRHLASGEPVRALHWIEIAASAEDPDVLRARQETLEALRARSGGVNHFETMWLDYRIKATREALGD